MIAAGAIPAADIRVGSQQALAVYAGDELVWSRPPFRVTAKGSIFYTLEGTGITIDFGDGTVVTGDYHHFSDASWDEFKWPQNETHTFADDSVHTVSFSGGIELITFADLSLAGKENTGILSVLTPLPHLGKWIWGDEETSISIFQNCRNLISVPTNLFANNSDISIISNYFYECNSLGAIPSGLLDPCKNITSISGLFEYCESIQSLPAGLFDKLTEVTNAYWTFGGCVSLRSIPAGLFSRCTKITSFEGTFRRCALTSIPAGLFDNCPDVINFRGTFGGCTAITGAVPTLWEDYTITPDNSWECFFECTNASNYDEIPPAWKSFSVID